MNYKWWILVALLIFGIGIALGLATPTTGTGPISEEIAALEKLSSMVAPFKVSTVIFIFMKNVLALLLSFALSPILCLMPVLTLSVNGWILALVSSAIIEEKSLGFLLAGVLPHGIIEIPALFIGEAAALSFGVAVMVALFKKEKRSLLSSSLKQNSRYLFIALALLLPAAIIETYITPLLVG
jgi:stage II sporulation protein M